MGNLNRVHRQMSLTENQLHPRVGKSGKLRPTHERTQPPQFSTAEQEQVSAPRGLRRTGLRCCPPQRTGTTLPKRQPRQNLNSLRRKKLWRSRPSRRESFRRTKTPGPVEAGVVYFIDQAGHVWGGRPKGVTRRGICGRISRRGGRRCSRASKILCGHAGTARRDFRFFRGAC